MPECRGQGFDTAILACRPINPADYEPGRKAMWNKAIATGLTVPPDYPGRIVMQCDDCGIDVQVGPRQQEAMKKFAAQVFCIICAVVVMAPVADETALINLGNPYKE